MDIVDLANGLKNVASSGFTLNLEERMQLQLALHKLNNDSNYD